MDERLLRTLSTGAQTVLDNAVQLYREALTLTQAGALSRALFLHQISMEEWAKVEIVGISASGLMMGEPVDLEKIAQRFRSHSRKNKVNAYFLTPSANEKSAQTSGRINSALAAFKMVQDRFHEKSNDEK